MRAKEYLYQLKDASKLIETLTEECERLKNTSQNQAIRYDSIKIKAPKNETGPQESSYISLEGLTIKVENELKKLANIETRALDVIAQIKDLRLRTVLIKYYIQNKTFEQTAVEMDLTYRWVCELHGQALKEFDALTGGDI